MNLCPRFIHTLYCDDVRQEVNGKMTFVGAYQGELNVQRAENTVLPKLCIVVNVQTPKAQPFDSIFIRVLKDEDVIEETYLPQEIIEAAKTVTPIVGRKYHTYGLIIELINLPIEKDCMIRVRARSESEELASAALQINLVDNASRPEMFQSVRELATN